MTTPSISERADWCYPITPPGPPFCDGVSEALLGAAQRRHADGLDGAPEASQEALRRLWATAAPPAWLVYAAAVRAMVDGAAQVEMFV